MSRSFYFNQFESEYGKARKKSKSRVPFARPTKRFQDKRRGEKSRDFDED